MYETSYGNSITFNENRQWDNSLNARITPSYFLKSRVYFLLFFYYTMFILRHQQGKLGKQISMSYVNL